VNGDFAIAEANHKAFSKMYPDCQVNFVIDKDNFIFAPPHNMKEDEIAYDEGRMTWNEYVSKWHSGALESDSDMRDYEIDIPDDEIERQIDELLKAEWN
jgi:hypothetical protein